MSKHKHRWVLREDGPRICSVQGCLPKRPGRKPLGSAPMTCRVTVRLSEAEQAQLDAYREDHGQISRAAALRRLLQAAGAGPPAVG